jgi:hypothetical protein
METSVRRLVLVLLVLLAPAVVLAQSLGDAAARQRREREAAGARKNPRVLTNDDLKGTDSGKATSPTTSPTPSSTTESSGSYQAQREATPEGETARGERSRLEQAQADVDSARSAVVAAEERVKGLQDKLNPMSGTFIYGPSGSNNANEEAQVRQSLTKAEAELADARAALVKANQVHEDVRLGRAPRPE